MVEGNREGPEGCFGKGDFAVGALGAKDVILEGVASDFGRARRARSVEVCCDVIGLPNFECGCLRYGESRSEKRCGNRFFWVEGKGNFADFPNGKKSENGQSCCGSKERNDVGRVSGDLRAESFDIRFKGGIIPSKVVGD